MTDDMRDGWQPGDLPLETLDEAAEREAVAAEKADEAADSDAPPVEEYVTPRQQQNVPDAGAAPREVPQAGFEVPPDDEDEDETADQSSQGGTLGGGTTTGF